MKYWLTTDTHFGDDRVIKYCGRPIDFGRRILDNLGAVQSGDVLIHLGDICTKEDAHWSQQIALSTLGAHRWLIRGNHDHRLREWYLEHGWEFVGESVTVRVGETRALLSHHPVKSSGQFDINIHGHFHNAPISRYETKFRQLLTDKHQLLALEYTNYHPTLLREILFGGKNLVKSTDTEEV